MPTPTRTRLRALLAPSALLAALALTPGTAPAGAGDDEGMRPVPEGGSAADELETARERLAELEHQLEVERAERAASEEALRAQVRALRLELSRATEERVDREREWLAYTQVFANLVPAAHLPERLFRPQLPEEELELAMLDLPLPDEPAPGRSERDREVFLALRSLFALEGVDGLEVLETGNVGQFATGPVVMRVIDAYGRPAGTIAAERLRFEASRAARTLSLVLEEGYERIGGRRVAFAGAPQGADRGGVRRIQLGNVDPSPWIRALPELFRPADHAPAADDGRWDLLGLRLVLNELLEREGLAGSWRLRSLGGVVGGELRDVMLEQREGAAARRQVVADRLRVIPEPRGLLLLLESGAQLSEGRKLPFLEGRYRIYLPRADVSAWRRAGLPGLVPDPPPDLQRRGPTPRG